MSSAGVDAEFGCLMACGTMVKRLMDGCGSLVGLIVLSPLLLTIAVAVIVTNGRPVFFRQVRVGRHGRDFLLWKFRSMSVLPGAEAGRFDAGSSLRVTPVGRMLRRAKLDELPQLWNVLRGEMSLVGPRPEVRKWVEAYPDEWARVLTGLPGITDPASVEFRNEEELLARAAEPDRVYRCEILPRKLAIYEDYLKTQSTLGDVRILWATLWALFR